MNGSEGIDLDEDDRLVGVVTLELLARRRFWSHRRVEQVTVEDPATFKRHVSVDFTIPDLPTPLVRDRKPLYMMPVALLRKGPLTNFSLRDAGGRVMPLMTRRYNSKVAAATLIALANRNVGLDFSEGHQETPAEIEQLIWDIVSQSPQGAVTTWDMLDARAWPHLDWRVTEWRACLNKDEDFLRLANDLARNFLMLTAISGRPGDRHVIKYSYEQVRNPPLVLLPPPLRVVRDKWLRLVEGNRIAAGVIELQNERLTVDWKRRMSVLVGARPMPIDFEAPAATQGGSYHLEVEAPIGLQVSRARLQACVPPPHRISAARQKPPTDAQATGGGSSSGATTASAASGQNEPQAPHSLPAVPVAESDASGEYMNIDVDRLSVSRAHLYVHTVALDADVRAIVELRPLAETVIRAATVSAAVTTVVLTVIAIRWQSFVANSGAISALLLTVPAALAAWAARSGEARTTGNVVYGIRLLAFLSGVYSLLALIVLSAGRTCSDVSERIVGQVDPALVVPGSVTSHVATQDCQSWAATPWLLGAFAAASAVILAVLLRSMTFVARPPERRGPSTI